MSNDLGLPGEDGLSIARQRREHWRCGLVIVTGRGDSVDKVVGLEVGADDYVTKPFELRELLARNKAALWRLTPREAPAPAVAAPAAQALLADLNASSTSCKPTLCAGTSAALPNLVSTGTM